MLDFSLTVLLTIAMLQNPVTCKATFALYLLIKVLVYNFEYLVSD